MHIIFGYNFININCIYSINIFKCTKSFSCYIYNYICSIVILLEKEEMEMIKNIIFDIGGIILEWGNNPLIELLNKTDYEVNKICKIIYGDSRFKECILGNLSQFEYMKQIMNENPIYSYDIEKILSEKYQEKALPVIKENLEKICELKNKEYKIYFLSNITDVSYNYLNDKLNILDMVDGGKYDR